MRAVELRVRFQMLVDGAQPFTSPLSIRVVHTEQADPLRQDILVDQLGLIDFIDPLESVGYVLERTERCWIIGTQCSISDIRDVLAELAGFRHFSELEQSGCQVRRGLHAVFSLPGALSFVSIYRILE